MSGCRLFLVSGRVQGVFYRASTAREARALGLTGHARNLPDGRVEVLACGAAGDIDKLEAWLWQGPPASEVADVRSATSDVVPPARFTTG